MTDPANIGLALVAFISMLVGSLILELSILVTEVLVSVPYSFGVIVIEAKSWSILYVVPETVTDDLKLM